MKNIKITFSNGEQYLIPAEIIAKSRAEYYVNNDNEITYEEEFDFTMTDNYELIDWLQSNMNWKDVKDRASKIATVDLFDYENEFRNAETEIIDS